VLDDIDDAKFAVVSGSQIEPRLLAWLTTVANINRPNFEKIKIDAVSSHVELLQNYPSMPGEDPIYPYILYHMLNMTQYGIGLRTKSMQLPDYVELWDSPNNVVTAKRIAKIGRLTIPRSYVYQQYRDSPLVHKYFDFAD
jgi:hypothetical protein